MTTTQHTHPVGSHAVSPKLELRSVGIHFSLGSQNVEILRGVSLEVKQQQFVSIVGPSGSGKSTLFSVIGGVVQPTAGRVWLDGQDVTGQRGRISYMPQQDTLFPWRKVIDNVTLAQEIAGVPRAVAREKASEWLKRVGLSGYESVMPHQLSGGMRQRVSFLRALLSPQELMCLDEPFGALDALTRMEMQQWLLRIWEENRRSVLFITHSIEEALVLSDRIYVLAGKPATIQAVIDVPFERPRTAGITSDGHFLALKHQIYSYLGMPSKNDIRS